MIIRWLISHLRVDFDGDIDFLLEMLSDLEDVDSPSLPPGDRVDLGRQVFTCTTLEALNLEYFLFHQLSHRLVGNLFFSFLYLLRPEVGQLFVFQKMFTIVCNKI